MLALFSLTHFLAVNGLNYPEHTALVMNQGHYSHYAVLQVVHCVLWLPVHKGSLSGIQLSLSSVSDSHNWTEKGDRGPFIFFPRYRYALLLGKMTSVYFLYISNNHMNQHTIHDMAIWRMTTSRVDDITMHLVKDGRRWVTGGGGGAAVFCFLKSRVHIQSKSMNRALK